MPPDRSTVFCVGAVPPRRRAASVWRGFLFAAGVLAMLSSASAQALENDFLSDESELFLDVPSVFDASKNEQKVSQAPVWVSVVTAEEIRQYGYRTLAELLGSIPGFYVDYDRIYQSLGIRGLTRPDEFSTRLLVLLDGVRVNDGGLVDKVAIDRGFLVDLNSIDRVEVSRGPGSSLYGSNAISAVVNVITKRGRDVAGLEVSAAVASNDTREYRATAGRRLDNGVEYRVSASRFDSGGNRRLFYPELDWPDEPGNNGGYQYNVDSELDENVDTRVQIGDWTFNAAASQRYKVDPTASGYGALNSSKNNYEDAHQQLGVHHEHAFGNNVRWSGDLYWQRYVSRTGYRYEYFDYILDPEFEADFDLDGEQIEELFEAGIDPFIIDPDTLYSIDGEYSYDVHWWGAQGQLAFYQFDKHALVVGADFRSNYRQIRRDIDDEGVWLDDKRSSSNWGIYLQDEYRLRDSISLLAGLRYDHFSTGINDATPRLGVVYTPDLQNTVKLLYSTAFRAPNSFELFEPTYDVSTNGGVQKNALKSERIDTYDLVWERSFGSALRLVVNPFYYRLRRTIEYRYGEDAEGYPTYQIVNDSGHIDSQGIDLALEGRLASGLKGQLAYSYQHTHDDGGSRLQGSPGHVAKAAIAIPLADKRFFLGIDTRYLGPRRSYIDQPLGGHTTTNVTLSGLRIGRGFSVSASIHNVFDKRYASPVGEFFAQDTIMQDGRYYRVQLGYRF